MRKFIKTTFVFLIFATFFFHNSAEAQLINKFDNLKGFTKTEDIVILDDFSEVDGLFKIGEAYSKARGATMFSAMNRLNSRAKKKLLEEATVRGASHVLITKRQPDDGIGLTSFFIGRLFSYQAILYRSADNFLKEDQVKTILDGNRFINNQIMSTNRNTFGANHSQMPSGKLLTIDDNTELFSKNNKLYITIKIPNRIGIYENFTYEIIGANENHILLSEEVVGEKKFRAYLMKKYSK